MLWRPLLLKKWSHRWGFPALSITAILWNTSEWLHFCLHHNCSFCSHNHRVTSAEQLEHNYAIGTLQAERYKFLNEYQNLGQITVPFKALKFKVFNFIFLKLKHFNQYHFSNLLPVNNYLFKVNIRNTRKRCEISWKLTIETPELRFSGPCVPKLS